MKSRLENIRSWTDGGSWCLGILEERRPGTGLMKGERRRRGRAAKQQWIKEANSPHHLRTRKGKCSTTGIPWCIEGGKRGEETDAANTASALANRSSGKKKGIPIRATPRCPKKERGRGGMEAAV